MALARNIRYLRKKQGWGQDVLAEKLGYKSYTTIQKWESGVSEPPLKVVHVLANLFGVDITDLTNTDLEFNQAPTDPGERSVGNDILDEVDVAFYGTYKELNASNKETLRAMARILKEQEDKG